MSGSPVFFVCKQCGDIVKVIKNSVASMITCCNNDMIELVPNTVDASVEKHLPAVTILDNSINVEIGSIPHPMQNDHHITFVCVETEHGEQCKYLKIGEEPKLVFSFSNDKPVAVYAYCNLHGLWKTKI